MKYKGQRPYKRSQAFEFHDFTEVYGDKNSITTKRERKKGIVA